MEEIYKLVGSKRDWENREVQLKLLKQFGLKENHEFLDFGCGVLRGGMDIINYLDDGKYHGYDISRKRLDVGEAQFAESGINKKIYLSDQMPNKKFDVIWAFQVFIHIADDIFDENLKLILAHLSGHAYITAYSTPRTTSEWGWMEYPHVLHDKSFYKAKFEPYNGTIVRETPAPELGGLSHIWRINN